MAAAQLYYSSSSSLRAQVVALMGRVGDAYLAWHMPYFKPGLPWNSSRHPSSQCVRPYTTAAVLQAPMPGPQYKQRKMMGGCPTRWLGTHCVHLSRHNQALLRVTPLPRMLRRGLMLKRSSAPFTAAHGAGEHTHRQGLQNRYSVRGFPFLHPIQHQGVLPAFGRFA
jgi:hypothetical protein